MGTRPPLKGDRRQPWENVAERVGELVIDVAGMELPQNVTLFKDHDNSLDSVVGSGVPMARGGQLFVSGTVADSESGNKVVQLSKDGVELQASVGAEVISARIVKPGQPVRVNGRTIKRRRPFRLVESSRLREVTNTPNGAGHKTAVSIAAKKGRRKMDGFETTQSPDEIQAEERQRIATIEKVTAGDWGSHSKVVSELKAKAVAGTMELVDLQGELLQLSRHSSGPSVTKSLELESLRASRPAAPNLNRNVNAARDTDVIEAKMLLRTGFDQLAEKTYGEQVCHAADWIRASSLVDLAAMSLAANGHNQPHGRQEMIHASFSTMSLPNALGTVVNKVLEAAFRESPATWRSFCAIRNASNFHTNTSVRPSFVGEMEKMAPDGEIKHGSLSEATLTWKIDTYAKMLSVTRQDIINDDISFLDEVSPLMTRQSLLKHGVDDLASGCFRLPFATFFHSSDLKSLVFFKLG